MMIRWSSKVDIVQLSGLYSKEVNFDAGYLFVFGFLRLSFADLQFCRPCIAFAHCFVLAYTLCLYSPCLFWQIHTMAPKKKPPTFRQQVLMISSWGKLSMQAMEDIDKARVGSQYSATTVASNTSTSATTWSSVAVATSVLVVLVTDSSAPEGLHARVNIVDLIEDAPMIATPIAPIKKLCQKYVLLTFSETAMQPRFHFVLSSCIGVSHAFTIRETIILLNFFSTDICWGYVLIRRSWFGRFQQMSVGVATCGHALETSEPHWHEPG